MLLSVFLFALLLALFARKCLKDYKYRDFSGPSPFLSLPMIGHGHLLLGRDIAPRLMEMRSLYGDLFRFDVGNYPTVFLCTHEMAAEAFKREEFSGRFFNQVPTFNATLKRDHKGSLVWGVVSGEGAMWQEQRRFMLKTLSDLGMGKRDTMEEVIRQEAEQVTEDLKEQSGDVVDAKCFFANATNNVIWRLVTGRRTRQDDPELTRLTRTIADIFKNSDPSNPFTMLQLNSLPFTRLVRWLGMGNYLDSIKRITDLVESVSAASEPNPGGNYIERGLAECQDEAEGKVCLKEPSGRMYIEAQATSLFLAGTDTTATALEWCVLYLLKYPEEQEKIFSEVSRITVGNRRRVTLEDRPEAHYTNAFIDEVFRHCPEGTIPPPHKTLADVTFRGKFIPKNTQIVYFGYAINQDERYFENPELFRPERFLTGPGGSYARNDKMVLFGLGKRKCPGELLARAEVFLFLATLVQTTLLYPAPGVDPASDDLSTVRAIPGVVFYPMPFQFVPKTRSGVKLPPSAF